MALHLLAVFCRHFPTRFSPRLVHRRVPQDIHTSHCRCLAPAQISQRATERRSANYKPTIWSDDIIQSLKTDYADGTYRERAKKLEKEVRTIIDNEDAPSLALLALIDDIKRLGLGYRFEEDISKALDRIIMHMKESDDETQNSIHATALRFRVLRQHGYAVSEDAFNSFEDHKSDAVACLKNDGKALLSLYEASYLGLEGENFLDEAKSFTAIHLKNLMGNMDKSLKEQVNHALELPLHRRLQQLEARWYIDVYSKRKDVNLLLLELAKLDFNMVQSTFQKEVEDMSRWWKGIGLASKLSFVRDRLMECFFCSLGMVSEPQFSSCRKGLTKVAALITTIDDVFDVYGSLDELKLFTDAVERWDVDLLKTLPEYMKICFLALYNTVNEMAYDTLKDQGEDIIPILRKAWADLCQAFLIEAKWNYQNHTPNFEAYLENAWLSASGVVILVHTYFLISECITKEAMESLDNNHDLLRWSSMIFRLCNDLEEIERGETANSILCYMRETGLPEELARGHISYLIDETWKKMNKVIVGESPFENPFVETAMNLARISPCTYQYGDGHGDPNIRSKNRVFSFIVEPIRLTEREKHRLLSVDCGGTHL